MGEFRRSRAPLQPADLAESFLGFVHRLACCIGQIYRELTKICQMAQALWRTQNVTHTHSQLPQTFLQGGCQVHAGEQLAVLPLCHASGLCFDANLPCFCAHACAACSLLQLLQRQDCLSPPLPELPKRQSTDSAYARAVEPAGEGGVACTHLAVS